VAELVGLVDKAQGFFLFFFFLPCLSSWNSVCVMSTVTIRRLAAGRGIPSINSSPLALASKNLALGSRFGWGRGSVYHVRHLSTARRVPNRKHSTVVETGNVEDTSIFNPFPRVPLGPDSVSASTRQYFKVVETEFEEPVSIYAPLDTFQRRHIGPNKEETQLMLRSLGYGSLDAFVNDVLPANILSDRKLEVEPDNGLSETQLLARLRAIASKNKVMRSYIGAGYYGTKTPAVIARNILESPEWYTSYTPYQPEISQGRHYHVFFFDRFLFLIKFGFFKVASNL